MNRFSGRERERPKERERERKAANRDGADGIPRAEQRARRFAICGRLVAAFRTVSLVDITALAAARGQDVILQREWNPPKAELSRY